MKIKITDDDDSVIYEAHYYGSNKVYSYINNHEWLDFVQRICLESNDNIENFINSSKDRKYIYEKR